MKWHLIKGIGRCKLPILWPKGLTYGWFSNIWQQSIGRQLFKCSFLPCSDKQIRLTCSVTFFTSQLKSVNKMYPNISSKLPKLHPNYCDTGTTVALGGLRFPPESKAVWECQTSSAVLLWRLAGRGVPTAPEAHPAVPQLLQSKLLGTDQQFKK